MPPTPHDRLPTSASRSILSGDRWRAASPHLDEALDLPSDQRPVWLAALQRTNPELAADVAALLSEHDALTNRRFLEEPVIDEPPAPAPADEAGASFGRYRLLQALGQGGMGTVWLAQQEHPIRRRVAVKVVKPGSDSRQVLSRFESERQALAILDHEHIAKVFDAGVTDDGRPYFVMEHVDGLPINAFADQHAMTIADRLELFLQVCDAVQHAHQKGVLHRDLKPGNLLVTERNGQPVAKVIDFGIAKAIGQHLTGDTLHTEIGVLVGTPEFMSPEQAGLVEAAVDTRTDIYSLGLILYELLIGFPPFDARALRSRTVLEVLRTIREDEPPRLTARLAIEKQATARDVAKKRRTEPDRLKRQLRGDLEWITARAIEKDPARRYASVSELRGDIDRHLHGEPVLAGPPSAFYRLRKLARRHRAAAAALFVIVIAVAVSAVVSTLSLARAVRAEDRTRRQLIGSLVAQGMQRVGEADPVTGLVYLTRALELETDPQRIRSHRIRIAETLQRSPHLVQLWRHEAAITMLALSSRDLIATGSTDGTIKLRQLSTGVQRQIQQGGAILDGEFSRDGAMLLVASDDGTIKIWDPGDGRLLREVGQSALLRDVAFSPDTSLVATILENGDVRVWDVRSGSVRFGGRHPGGGVRALFSNSGTLLATAGSDGVRLWHVRTGLPSGPLLRHDGEFGVTEVAFAHDDRWLATAGWDYTARLWDPRTGRQVGNAMRHDGAVNSVTFADDSNVLVTTSNDQTTRVWRVPENVAVGAPRTSTSIPALVDVSRNLVIASPTQQGVVNLWSIQGGRAAADLPHGAAATVRFDSTGRFLLTADADGLARIWDLSAALPIPASLAVHEGDFHWRAVASPDGTSIAGSISGSRPRSGARVFDVRTGLPVTPTMRFSAPPLGLAFSPDGSRLVTASIGGELRVWDAASGEPVTLLIREEAPLHFAAFSPDGETFVVSGGLELGASGMARIRNARDGSPITDPLPHDSVVKDAWFSPDGQRLVTATQAGALNLRLWDTKTGHLLWGARHPDGVSVARWAPDGSTIFTGGFDQRVRSWNSSSGLPASLVLKTLGTPTSMDLTRDGTKLIAGTGGGDIRLADTARTGRLLSLMFHKGFVYESRFSPDASLALTSAGDHTARLWDVRTGEPLTPGLTAGAISRSATFLRDGRSWVWTGVGIFVDELDLESRAIPELQEFVESAAARGLTESGTEIALAPDEVEARFAKRRGAQTAVVPPAPAGYYRAEALTAWRRQRHEDVIRATTTLRAQHSLNWQDVMRLVGAYAATAGWQEALQELRTHRGRWSAAPELLYMESVALVQSGDHSGAARLCRAALETTRGTRHPERAYWAARTCLLPPATTLQDRAEIQLRIETGYEQVAGNLGRAQLQAALLLRSGQAREAFGAFESAVPTNSTVRPALLLTAIAAVRGGRRADALKWLTAADAVPRTPLHLQMRPWLEAEADALRRELIQALGR